MEGGGRRLDQALELLTRPDTADFTLQVGTALATGRALRELVELALAHEQRAGIDPRAAADAAVGVPAEVREEIGLAVAEAEQAQSEAVRNFDFTSMNVATLTADPLAGLLRMFGPQRAAASVMGQLLDQVDAAPDPEDAEFFLATYLYALVPPPARSPAYPAILAAVCAAVESVLARALRRLIFTAGTGHASILEPGLDDAVQDLIGSGGALAKWTDGLAPYGVDLQTLMANWDEYVELFARRNLFLHRGGRVDTRYRDRVPTAPALGTQIDLTGDYLRDAVDRCEVLMVAIPLTLLARGGAAQLAASCAGSLARFAQHTGQTLRVEGFSHLAAALDPDRLTRQMNQVNAWLARSERLGAPSIAEDVEQWDVQDLPPEFALARLILLGKDEKGLALLAELREQGVIGQTALDRWPLFDRWRRERRI